jgi:saxitoxin biosynthesis operon SxtJ-like protein
MTAAEGRKFAATLTLGFAALAGIALWRNHPHSGRILGAIGLLVLLAGLFVPARLGPASRAWTGMGEAISRVTSPLIFGILYYLVFTPVGVLRRTIGSSPLTRSADASTFWTPRPPHTAEEARRGMEHLF